MVSTIVMRRLRLLKNAIETFMDSFRKAVDNDWKKYCSDFFPEIEVKKKNELPTEHVLNSLEL